MWNPAECKVPYPVQVRTGSQGDEELAAIGVRACIGHGENASSCMVKLGVQLILDQTVRGL